MVPTATGSSWLFSDDVQTAQEQAQRGRTDGKPATWAARHPPSCKEKGFNFGKKDLKIISKPGNTP